MIRTFAQGLLVGLVAGVIVAGLVLAAAAVASPRYTVESTAYSLCSSGTTMANGRHVRWGAVANNMLALGTRIRLVKPVTAHRPDGKLVHRRYFTVADRIGSGSQLDVWHARCDEAIQYGRRIVTFKVVST